MFFRNNNLRDRWEFLLFLLTVCLYIYRTSYPTFKFFFPIGYLILIITYSIKHKPYKTAFLKKFISSFTLPLILISSYAISLLFLSTSFHNEILKDLINSIILISFFFFFTSFTNSIKIETLLSDFYNLLFYFSVLVTFLTLLDSFNINTLFYDLGDQYIDYNVRLIPIFFSLIYIVYYQKNDTSRLKNLLYTIILFCGSYCIITSGSRRGLFAFAIYLIISIVFLIKNKIKNTKLNISFKYYLSLISFSLVLISFLLFWGPSRFRYDVLKIIGTKNAYTIKHKVTNKLYRYISIANSSITYSNLYNDLWLQNSDPKKPYSGWGSEYYFEVFPLSGNNVNIVPANSHGYMMNHKIPPTYINNFGAYSFTKVGQLKPNIGDSIKLSAYCYVSPDFDGTWAQVRMKHKEILHADYNLNKKGTWQKLVIKTIARNNDIHEGILTWHLKNNINFDSLSGNIIFAHPEFNIKPNNQYFPDTLLSNLINYNFDSRHPGTGWGNANYKLDFPLDYGELFEIVPENTYGLKLDHESIKSNRNGYGLYYNRVSSKKVKAGDSLVFSAYCYISPDFNGDWAQIRVQGKSRYHNDYNLSKKGMWQKLKIHVNCTYNDDLDLLFYFAKKNDDNFKNLSGYAVYAYPEIQQININRSSRINFSNSDTNNSLLIKSDSLGILKEKISNLNSAEKELTSFDKEYYPFISNIVLDSIHNLYLDLRLSRWQLAIKIFQDEYNWKKKLIGGGFDYLNWYGYFFYRDINRKDWPHNPFLSVLLYSGIIGAVIYGILFFKVFVYYIKYYKRYNYLFICFLITFFFSFFSANSPFTPPIMGFFVILPFFINYIEKKTDIN